MALRRTLALVGFCFGAFFLLLGVESMTADVGGGCANLGAGFAKAFAPGFIVVGAGALLAAVTAWKGTRLWWAWLAAMPAWGVCALVAVFIWLSVIE